MAQNKVSNLIHRNLSTLSMLVLHLPKEILVIMIDSEDPASNILWVHWEGKGQSKMLVVDITTLKAIILVL